MIVLSNPNREEFAALADFIEKHEVKRLGFNMANYIAKGAGLWRQDRSGHRCNTIACLAGWEWHRLHGRRLALGAKSDFGLANKMYEEARDALGMTDREATYLFHMDGYMGPYTLGDVTEAQAVAVLRHAVDTGVLDWDRVLD